MTNVQKIIAEIDRQVQKYDDQHVMCCQKNDVAGIIFSAATAEVLRHLRTFAESLKCEAFDYGLEEAAKAHVDSRLGDKASKKEKALCNHDFTCGAIWQREKDDAEIDRAYKNADTIQYTKGYNRGQQRTLEMFRDACREETVCVDSTNGREMFSHYLAKEEEYKEGDKVKFVIVREG